MHRIHYDEVSEAFFIQDGANRYGEFKTALEIEVFLTDNGIIVRTITAPAIRRMLQQGVRYVRSN